MIICTINLFPMVFSDLLLPALIVISLRCAYVIKSHIKPEVKVDVIINRPSEATIKWILFCTVALIIGIAVYAIINH